MVSAAFFEEEKGISFEGSLQGGVDVEVFLGLDAEVSPHAVDQEMETSFVPEVKEIFAMVIPADAMFHPSHHHHAH